MTETIKVKEKLPTLKKFATNLTQKFKESNDFSVILGRENETRELLSIIVQKYKNNGILVGEGGVGKTAIIEGVAQMLAFNLVPQQLKGFELWELNLPSLTNKNTEDGGYHYRMEQIIREVEEAQNIILFVDETHVILDKESELDCGDLIKPALARGVLRMIGSTTDWEYHKYIEQDKALVRRYQKVVVQELKREPVIRILKSRKRPLEVYHGVTITTPAIVEAVDLATRYLPSRKNPDKAIDVLDKACALRRLEIDAMPKELKMLQSEIGTLETDLELEDNPETISELEKEIALKKPLYEKEVAVWEEQKAMLELIRKSRKDLVALEQKIHILETKQKTEKDVQELSKMKVTHQKWEEVLEKIKTNYYKQPNLMIKDEVDPQMIQKTIESITGIPVSELTESEIDKLLKLEDNLGKQVMGQEHAIRDVAYAIKRSRMGISKPEQPIGCFIFLGPSGVGKALRNSEKIPTPDRGLVELKNLSVGDKVFNRKGIPVTITGVFPQGERQFYSVVLSDGRTLDADKEHLFSYVLVKKGRKPSLKMLQTKTVAEIITEMEENPEKELYLPNNEAVEYTDNKMERVESLYFAVGKYTETITSALKMTSQSQRLDILRGAFDIYGHIKDKKLYFEAKGKPTLVSDIREILFSLGISNQLVLSDKLEICYKSREQVFSLFGKKERKDEVFVKIPKKSPYKHLDFVVLKEIKKQNLREEATCILIEDEEHLFLAGENFVVTHNTELVRSLAFEMFGDKDAMKRFDCGELKSQTSVARLIGADPGIDKMETGGEMTEYVKKNPYSILLFDEAEKGHPDIFDMLLSVADTGKLADSRGNEVDFRNTIIILTSNIGQQTILMGQDKKTGELPQHIIDSINAQLKNQDRERGGKGFKPEFVNRLDSVVIFYKLKRKELEKIANLKLRGLTERLYRSRKIKLTFSDKIHEVFKENEPPQLDVGYLLASPYLLSEDDLNMGGRPIERLITREIEDKLTDMFLIDRVPDGSHILIEATYIPGFKVREDEYGMKRPASPIIKITQISDDEYNYRIQVDPVANMFKGD